MKLTYILEFEDGFVSKEKTINMNKLLLMVFKDDGTISPLFIDDKRVNFLENTDRKEIIIKASKEVNLEEISDITYTEEDLINSIEDAELVISFTNKDFKKED